MMFKNRNILIIFLSFFALIGLSTLFGYGTYKNRGDYSNDTGDILLSSDEAELVFYNLDDPYVSDILDANTVSLRASGSLTETYYMRWPIDSGEPNSVLMTPMGATNAQLVWAQIDSNQFDVNYTDVNNPFIGLPVLTPGSRIFVDANGYPLFEDNDNAYFDDVNDFAGFALGHITGDPKPNNYIQVYYLLNFDPDLLNTSVGWARDDVLDGPNNVRIGEGAGGLLETAKENSLGGKDAGRYLVDANDNSGWGYKVIGGSATIGGTPEYPTLQELTAAEIPDAPAEPVVTPATTSVSNYAELQAMTGAGKYYLTTDIDLTGVTWTPIATTASGFVLDGRGFTISNLTINAPTSDYQALFGTLAAGSQIDDVIIDSFTVTGKDYTSCLVGSATGGSIVLKDIRFTDCTLTGRQYVGNLIGRITNADNDNIYDCNVTGCAVIGSITEGQVKGVGGLIGYINGEDEADAQTNFVNCYVDSTSTITWTGGATTSWQIGGFAGTIIGSSGDISATQYMNVHTCYSEAELSFASDKSSFIGGFAGEVDNVVLFVNCYATGGITSTSSGTTLTRFGGFFGDESTYGTYINCYSTGTISISSSLSGASSISKVGGFFGNLDYTTRVHLLHCWSTSEIIIPTDCENVGGFVGFSIGLNVSGIPGGTGALVERCWSTGDITLSTSPSPRFIGCFWGGHWADDEALEVKNCYSWGSITIDDADNISYLGGLFGIIEATVGKELTLTNCYDAQTDTAVGSGYSDQVPAGSLAGGIACLYENVEDQVIETALFWDTETSGLDVSQYGVGHITSWMQTKTNYEAAGWDFDTIWYMPEIIGPDVHRVTAIGAYAASNVVEGADDGLYLGTYSGQYNTTDPNRFFLDNLDRGDYPGNQQHGMMYGYFDVDPNDQWLTFNVGELNLDFGRFDVNDVNVANDLTVAGDTYLTDVNITGTLDVNDVNVTGLTIAGFDEGSVLFTDVNGLVTQDNTNFNYDDTGDVLNLSGLTVTGNEINIATTQTPASATAAGTTGDMAWDSDYVYVAVASNTWKRAALTTWGIPAENVIYAGENVIFAAEQVVYP